MVSSSAAATDRLIHGLRSQFAVKDLGRLHYFLGVEVSHHHRSLVLTQQKYAGDLLRRAGMTKCKSVSTPMSATEHLSAMDGDLLDAADSSEYRSIVGGLQYLTITRPDLSFSVNKVCQFIHAPRSAHWSAVKLILRYVQHTPAYGLHIRASASPVLGAFSDADWAVNPDDRRSMGGYAIFYGPNLVA